MKKTIIKIESKNILLNNNITSGKSKIKEIKSSKKFPKLSDIGIFTDILTENKTDSIFKERKILMKKSKNGENSYS